MFNNFLKSMMALCIVTSGFSSSSDEDGYGGSDIVERSTGVTGVVLKPTPDKNAMMGFSDETDTKSPLNVGKSLRKTSDNSVQSTNTTVISSQKTSETESDANTSTSSEEGQSPQKERGVLTISTYANDTTEGSAENRNLVVSNSSSSEGSIETVESKQENNVSSVVQFDGIDIVQDITADENSEINASHSSDGSIETVDEGTQTIGEEKLPSTKSETMNKSINTVESEGHSLGEEGVSGSDDSNHNEEADTSTSIEDSTRPMETQTENNENRRVDIVEDCGNGEDSRAGLMHGTTAPQEDESPDFAELERIIGELNSLDDLKSVADKVSALYTEVNNYNGGWMSDYSRDLCKSRIVNIVKSLLNDTFDPLLQVDIADNLDALKSLSYSYYVWHKDIVSEDGCAKLLQTINLRLNKEFSEDDLLKALNKRIDSLTGY